jgi:hypothetical protein
LTTSIGLLAMTKIGQWYWVKQPAIAVAIRLIATQAFFSATGPTMNPMLPTTYSLFADGAWPTDLRHYAVYWASSSVGAGLAAIVLDRGLGITRPAVTPTPTQEKKKA